ncbi:ABC transporter substrate-binding protein [Candidatus Epulonipiscium viviparus]|uniref:ABC transporter substrate-binding protein n=1 Tax=Candidatus Epulonipiscium viviparus TaxID=420336 RepID=UPI0027380DC1|nr:extracellular solute-binding protein [Candidatus Epulopiscium viviparus]
MNLRKFLCLGLAVLTIGALTACGGEEETAATTETSAPVAEVAEPEEPVRDLGGLVVTLANWVDIIEPEVKGSAYEEALWEHRHAMMEKHNFKFEELALAPWNGMLELFSTSVLADDPAAEIFRFHASNTLAVAQSGLAYDLSTLDSIDVNDSASWNISLAEVMTIGDEQYGVGEQSRPKQMIYFNKRLFEDAGLDPNLLYDLQASGDWTWETFMEISEILTRDTDNDGVNDIYAIVMNPSSFAESVIMSNDGKLVYVDDDGVYKHGLDDPKVVAALEWAAEYWKTDYDLVPAHWNGHKDAFLTSQAAMYLGNEWESTTLTQDQMPDDWGLVTMPKGPNAADYKVMYSDSGWVIPASYSKEEAEDIAFALDLWYGPVPGYDGPDDWKTTLYPLYRDERAIDETVAMARKRENSMVDLTIAIADSVNVGLLSSDVYWNRATVAESIEAQKGIWQAALDKVNAK